MFGEADRCLIATGGIGNKKAAAEKLINNNLAKSSDIMVYADGLQETISQRAQGSRQGISLGSTHAMSEADHAGVAKISFRPSELPRGFDQHLPDESSHIKFDTGRLQPRSLQKFRNSAEEWLQTRKEMIMQWIPTHARNEEKSWPERRLESMQSSL